MSARVAGRCHQVSDNSGAHGRGEGARGAGGARRRAAQGGRDARSRESQAGGRRAGDSTTSYRPSTGTACCSRTDLVLLLHANDDRASELESSGSHLLDWCRPCFASHDDVRSWLACRTRRSLPLRRRTLLGRRSSVSLPRSRRASDLMMLVPLSALELRDPSQHVKPDRVTWISHAILQ